MKSFRIILFLVSLAIIAAGIGVLFSVDKKQTAISPTQTTAGEPHIFITEQIEKNSSAAEGLSAVAGLSIEKSQDLPQSAEKHGQMKTIQARIRVGEQTVSVDVPEGNTVYDGMKAAQEQNLIEFRGRKFSGLGFFVQEINGVQQDFSKNMVWIYYLNGNKAKVGISNTIIKPNDVIEWKYEKME